MILCALAAHHAKELLEPHGDLCNTVNLFSYLMQTVPHLRGTHILICYFHPTLNLLFRILPLLCVILFYTALFWKGIGYYKTSSRFVSMTYFYFQKYCVWTSFNWIQFRSALGSPALGSLQEMSSPLQLSQVQQWDCNCHVGYCAYTAWSRCFSTQRTTVNLSVHTESTINEHDTEIYAFFWSILTTLSVRFYSIGGMVLTREGWYTQPVPAPLCLPPIPHALAEYLTWVDMTDISKTRYY